MIVSKRVTSSGVTIFTASKATAVTTIILCNTGADLDNITINAVPNGGAASFDNIILLNHAMSQKRTFIFNLEKFILNAGDCIVATTAKGNITATVSGMILE